MTDLPFLLSIIGDPKEDGPRLVYADYLEETGRCERAEYIRLSIEMVYGQVQHGGRCWEILRKMKRELLGFDPTSLKTLHEWWSRGFLSEVSLTEADFLKCAPQLCWHPIEKVTLTGKICQHYHNITRVFGLDNDLFGWLHKQQQELKTPYILEGKLWQLVRDHAYEINGNWADFQSEKEANEALNQACLSYLNSLRALCTPDTSDETSPHSLSCM